MPCRTLWTVFTEFTANSTIHGVRYLGERGRPFSERIWWIIVFVISISMCNILIEDSYRKWYMSPVIISFAETPTSIWQIPFPAVTICPETKTQTKYISVTKSFLNQPSYADLTEEELRLLNILSQVCQSHLFTDFENKTASSSCIDDLKKMAPTDVIVICKWGMASDQDCLNWFTQIITEDGICYSFNMLNQKEIFREDEIQQDYQYFNHSFESHNWTLDDGYSYKAGKHPYPKREFGIGDRSGLLIVLKLNEEDLDYMCRGPIQGFKIVLHMPDVLPQVTEQYFRVPLGQEVIVSVRPNMITTEDSIQNYNPDTRQCYFNKERYLRYFQLYTQKNCELECLSNYTVKRCGCAKFSMPRDSETPICGAGSVQCYNDAKDELLWYEFNEGHTNKNYLTKSSCNCLPTCTSISYDTEISQTNFDFGKLSKALKLDDNETEGLQMSRIIISFKEAQFISLKRSELYGFTEFLANCGGLLGLFMGVSMLSIIEIIYFCTIRLFHGVGAHTSKNSINQSTSSNEIDNLKNDFGDINKNTAALQKS